MKKAGEMLGQDEDFGWRSRIVVAFYPRSSAFICGEIAVS